MLGRVREVWLPRLCFVLTAALALGLALAVVVAPWFAEAAVQADGWPEVLSLFAYDAVVRRTALVSAAGLLVTAVVFFRPSPSPPDEPKPPKRPGQMAGA
jgi:hypothetical protein